MIPPHDDETECPVCGEPESERNPHAICEAVLWPPRPTN